MKTIGCVNISVAREQSHVCVVSINRIDKRNALNVEGFQNLGDAFRLIGKSILDADVPESDPLRHVRCVVLKGEGKHFCSGIDLSALTELSKVESEDPARTGLRLRYLILQMQDNISAIEACPVPVIAAVHGVCIGAGVDIVAACDLVLASADSKFSVKEIDLAIPADLGSLQRLPHIVGIPQTKMWAYTGMFFDAAAALTAGLLIEVQPTPEKVMLRAMDIAGLIVTKSPVAMVGTKEAINRNTASISRDGLSHLATLNASILQSDDGPKIVEALMKSRKQKQLPGGKVPQFSKI